MKYDKEDFERIKKNYELESLEFYKGVAQRDLEAIKSYLIEVDNQIEKVKNTQFKQYVYIKRQAYNKVEYFVGLQIYPDIPENQGRIMIYTITKDPERFAGKNKKQAKEYAQQLAKKYNCEIRE